MSWHVPYLLIFKPDENKEMLFKCIKTARSFAKDPSVYAVYDKVYQALQKERSRLSDIYSDAKWGGNSLHSVEAEV